MTTANTAIAKKKIRLLIVDREGVFRLGLKRVLGVEDDLRVMAQAASSDEAVALAREFKPEVIFLQAEIARPNMAGLFADLKEASPEVKIVITATALGDEEPVRYVQSGAAGVILRSVEPSMFVKCTRKVSENEMWLPKKQVAQMAKLLEGSVPVRPRDTLTHREKTIISYLMQGWRNREIARHLGITEQTVKNHLRTVYDKVGVSDRLELVLYAIHQRLDLPPTGPAAAAPVKPARPQQSSHDAA